MSAQHTPGPWSYAAKPSDDPSCPEFLILQGAGYIATVDSSRDENGANAHLIAAAPEMADAIDGLIEMAKAYGLAIDARVERALKVRAKARGAA